MQHSATMRIRNGVADINKAPQKLAERQSPLTTVSLRGGCVIARDRVLQAVSSDEAHGIKGTAIGIGPESVNRDDAGMLQASRYLGLQDKAGAALRVIRVRFLNLLEGNFAMKLFVSGQKDLAQAAAR